MRFQVRMRWLALMAALMSAAAASADVPRLFSYQGRLAGYEDEVVELTVSIWDAPSGGNQLFTEIHPNVPLTGGIFAIRVGSERGGVPPQVVVAQRWIGLAVDGGTEMLPRTRLVSVPFAYSALAADKLVIPGTFTAAATVEPDGHVLFEDKVELGAAGDDAGLVRVFNAADVLTARVDGGDAGDAGGRLDVFNGATPNIATIELDGNDANDGRIDVRDADNMAAIRLHADLQNDAPELSLFVGSPTATLRETVQIAGNYDPDSAGAGEVRLRRVDDAGNAITTVELQASSDNGLDEPSDGGQLILRHSDGSPVFTVHAGDGASAISPTWMELRNAQGSRRMDASPASLKFYDNDNVNSISLVGTNGTASFTGEVSVGVLTITGGSDLSERFDIRGAGAAVEPGMVVSIDSQNPGRLVVSATPYDRTVTGVISGANGVRTGMLMSQTGTLADGQHPVALTGRVWVHCDATAAAIEPGDLLTSSATPGHAMKAADARRAGGATLGKAMTALAAGERGMVLVLVNLQ